MDAARYSASIYGRPTREAGNKFAFTYFLPEHLPRSMDLPSEVIYALSEADSSLGHLQGLNKLIRDPDLLMGPFMTREAVASSRIEGTKTTFLDMMQADEVDPTDQIDDIQEVRRYLAASNLGLALIKDLPITQRFICQLHEALMQDVRGQERLPGELRKSPVWIGSGTHTLETARYVAPIPSHLSDLLSDWERFVNEPNSLPILIRCALMHYQFETIHPFLDGNGRIGRLLIGFMLIREQRLTSPILYLSGYLERHRSEYYDRLQGVREKGEINEWLLFFLRAVQVAAEDAVGRASQLVELREQYLHEASAERSRVAAVIPLIFRNPLVSANAVQRATDLTLQGARNLLSRAEELGWITKFGAVGQGRRTLWVARKVLEVLQEPQTYTEEADQEPEETQS